MSWKIHYMKEILGMEDIRNEILEKFIFKKVQKKGIIFGKTFGVDNYNEINPYCDSILKLLEDANRKERYLIFTATNIPDPYTKETHYQSFVVDFETRQLFIFDPAKRRRRQGVAIYTGFVTDLVVVPKLQHVLTPKFEIPTVTPQLTVTDTFCQTWSLWMVIHFLNSKYTLEKESKYKTLYAFYQQLVKLTSICNEMKRKPKTGKNCTFPLVRTEDQAKFFLLDNFDV